MSTPTRFAALTPGFAAGIGRIIARAQNALADFAAPRVEGVALASPLRRWLASACDALLLFATHLLVITPLTYFVVDQLAMLSVALVVSPVACWFYLWWGWARGQTPGQKLWRVRIIADDGEAMTSGRALKRLAGYAFVCLGLKIGLLPILFDPLRRGWHDRFAQTLVVDDRAPLPDNAVLREAFGQARHIEARQRRARPLPIAPDFALARRGWPLVFAAYLILSVALTWPVAPLWRTALAGDGGDAWVFVWNNWFFSHALATGGPLLSTDLLFLGFQTPLLFHTMNWFDCALAWPLLRFFSPVETYNLIFLLTPALCAFAAYWLACSLSRSRLASFVVAPVFGFSPYFMAHGLGHANLTAAQMLPVFAGLFYGALVCERARYAIGAGVALALAGLCDWQYLTFGGISALALWAGVEWSLHGAGQSFRWQRAGLGMGAVLGAVLLLSPLLLPAMRENRQSSYMDKSRQAGRFGADTRDWTRAGKLHPVFSFPRREGVSNENDLTPGWCVLALCALGIMRARRLRPWCGLGCVALVLACGPWLMLNWNELALLIGTGAPGNGLSPPWNTASLVTLNHSLAIGLSPLSVQGNAMIEMPFGWLFPHLPMLKAFRVPARLGVLVLMCGAPLAAIGLKYLLELARPRQQWLRPLIAVAVAFGLIFEYSTFPFPVSEIKVPAFYQRIARDPRAYAVADVPIVSSSRAMGWQTVHGKAMLVGVTARCPPEAFDLVARNALLRALSTEIFTAPAHPNLTRPGPDYNYAPALRELRALNVRYLVAHKSQLAGTEGARMVALLDHLQLPVAFEDADTRVYQVVSDGL